MAGHVAYHRLDSRGEQAGAQIELTVPPGLDGLCHALGVRRADQFAFEEGDQTIPVGSVEPFLDFSEYPDSERSP